MSKLASYPQLCRMHLSGGGGLIARHTFGVAVGYARHVMNANAPCPTCGSQSSRRIVWTNDPDEAGTCDARTIVLAGSRGRNAGPGPDRACPICGRLFCSDRVQQRRFDAETSRRFARFEVQDPGNVLWFEPQTPFDRIADALIRRLRLGSEKRESA